jgi:hypothetical protein
VSVVLLAALAMGAARTDGTPGVAPSTAEMAALLKERAAAVDPLRLGLIVNDRRAELLERTLAGLPPGPDHRRLRAMYAIELLNSGRIPESLAVLDEIEREGKENAPAWWKAAARPVLLTRASAWLRLAENRNCHSRNNGESCLLPIRGQGVHADREGSTRAIEVLQRILEVEPDSLQARWLLNVAHMTVGGYPDGVDRRYLIPPSVFVSEYALPRFDNVAREAGLDIHGLAGGALLDDFDRDGELDLVVSHQGFADQVQFFKGSGKGTFVDRTEPSGLMGEVGGLNMIHADYDNDGLPDVLVLRGGWLGGEGRFPVSLIRNRGDGTFADATREAGLLGHLAPTQAGVFFDYDGDGFLDLFLGNESAGPRQPTFPCELFRNNGNGTFTNVAQAAGVDVTAFVKGVAAGDFDGDGRPDLFLSTKNGDNMLLRNEGPAEGGAPGAWRFRDVARAAGVTEPYRSFGTFFFDYDNDGHLDLWVTGYGFADGSSMAAAQAADYLGLPHDAERGRLFRNRGDGTFEDVTRAAGLYRFAPAMGLNFGDLDNDGWLDIYLGTGDPDLTALIPNRMFRNAEGRSFQDVTTAGNFGHLQKGHGIAFGDVDGDGDQDVFEQMGGAFADDKAYSALYRNPGNTNRWVLFELEGVKSNRGAIGARIKVTVDTPRGPRALYRTVTSGGSFGGSPLRQHVGLGDARRITALEVSWPATGQTQRLPGVEMGRRYRIREGASAATAVR